MTALHLKKLMARSRLRHGLVLIMLALACFALPIKARAGCDATGDIRFRVTLKHPASGPEYDLCLFVLGPFYRSSEPVRIQDLTVGQPCTFYAAKETIFSPWGEWGLHIDSKIAGSCIDTAFNIVERRTFRLRYTNYPLVIITLDPVGGGRFDIKVGVSAGLTGAEAGTSEFQESAPEDVSAQPTSIGTPEFVSVSAFLGDSFSDQGTPDSDVFNFAGTAGDSVRLRLKADTKGGNNGGHATLRFVGPPTREKTGALPLEVRAELGSTATYGIAIEQAVGQGEKPYRGGYILTVESLQGKIHALVPTNSVEK